MFCVSIHIKPFERNPITNFLPVPTALGVMAYAVDPGAVNTEITRHMRRPLVDIKKTMSFMIKTPAEGAYTTIYCIVMPEHQLLTGGYYKSV